MRYLSLFSGIEAATAAWHPLGWECVAVAEIEPFPSAVLAHHYPGVRNLGDVTKLTEMDVADLGPIDVVVFGSPCQDLSVAGKRKGLAGARSGLFFTALQIIAWSRLWCGTRFALWENVPGAFSSNRGADFAAVVDELSGLADSPIPPKGWGTEGCTAGPEAMVEWSTLDAQWFGVAQRRRRVFALADFGDWAGRPPILLEPQGLRGDTAPRREAGQGVAHSTAPSLTSSGRGVARTGDTRGQDPVVAHTLRGEGFDTSEDGTGRGTPLVPVAFGGNNTAGPIDVATARNACASASGRMDFESETFLVNCRSVAGVITSNYGKQVDNSDTALGPNVVAYTTKLHNTQSNNAGKIFEERSTRLDANSPAPALLTAMQVRRLTPVECERLQGFPDNFTQIPWRKKPADQCPDGPRYKALGNSMAVPVMRWIGRQIDIALLFQE